MLCCTSKCSVLISTGKLTHIRMIEATRLSETTNIKSQWIVVELPLRRGYSLLFKNKQKTKRLFYHTEVPFLAQSNKTEFVLVKCNLSV